nr:tricarballylate utilization 4Fe-4S protein TcuB [uncultured Cohaesibacter sp.]
MLTDLLAEARRQSEICNACRYCEGYCSVFPALHRERAFSDADLTQLANLCHNCRGCYYACQYTAPHEFNLNFPKAMAELRAESWQEFAYPASVARTFQTRGTLIAIATMLAFAVLFGLAKLLGNQAGGAGFYAVLSHNMMVAIFAPAFLLPIVSLIVSLRRYWQAVGGGAIQFADIKQAFGMAAKMTDLAAGHGQGCNFEEEDKFSQARRQAHHAIMYGFLLCFAATSVATLMHYLLDMPAPYGLFSAPKLLGLTGGILLTIGCGFMLYLKLRSDRDLGAPSAWSGEIGFILLLGFVALSGLLLYALGSSPLMPLLLALHLGSVLAFFLLTPFTKMAHGFYRLAALIKEAQKQRLAKA